MTMPKRLARREHSIDYAGATLFAVGAAALFLALAWGGATYAWTSTHVVGALAAGVLVILVFVAVERRATEPLVPFELLRRAPVAVGASATLLGGICFFGVIAYVPLFVQGVIGHSATASAAVLTPFMLGTVTGSIGSGQFVSRTGRYRINALLGPVFLGSGMLLLWRMGEGTSTWTVARDTVIAGLGLGLMNQTFIVTAQNAVAPSAIGTVTGFIQFSRALGTALGVTVFGAIVNQGAPRGVLGNGRLIGRLSTGERSALASAFHPAFLFGASLAGVILLIVFLAMKERPLRRSVVEEPSQAEA
jgi:predicted MFS family arabinose efflux permease